MDPVTTLEQLATATGHGDLVPVIASGAVLVTSAIGFFSLVATKYPVSWKGAATIHRLALLVGNAKPATPASSSVPTGK